MAISWNIVILREGARGEVHLVSTLRYTVCVINCTSWLPCCNQIGKLKGSKEVVKYVFEQDRKNHKVCHSAHDA